MKGHARWVFWVWMELLSGWLHGQSPYRISQADAYIAPAVALFAGAGFLLQSQVKPLTSTQIAALDVHDVPDFDRLGVVGVWQPRMARLSDGVVIASCIAPLAVFAGKQERGEFWKIALMGAEAGLTSFGLVNTTKRVAQRTRPFVYGTAAPLDEKFKPAARLSYFSGHTTFTATACFFGAKIFHDYHPQSKLRPLVWTVAALAPVGMGYLRMRAGKHFLSDVVTGYVVGATTGFLVPWLHRDRRADKVSVTPSFWGNGSGVVIDWRF